MTKVKICGLKSLADVDAVNEYLPEYAGFVFANTKRFVSDSQAKEMKSRLAKEIKAVGVFVNEPIEHVIDLCNRKIIDVVQLHGEENEEYIQSIREKTDAPVIKAIKVQTKEQVLNEISKSADFMLYDTYKAGVLGGSGEQFPLEILVSCIEEWKRNRETITPFFLAGGLNAENVRACMNEVFCYGVDVSSGVETDGIKDREKIKNFIQTVRKTER